jgi:F0F1-type ATP synthase assembly protein I
VSEAGGGRRAARNKSPTGGSQFVGIGLAYAASVALFSLAGYWCDKKFGTSPVLTILGLFVSASAGFFSIYRKGQEAMRSQKPGARDQ